MRRSAATCRDRDLIMRTIFYKLESGPRFERLRGRTRRKRGVVLIAVLVLLSVSLTLFGLWSQAAIREHNILATQQFRVQAGRLAEAGLQRALSMRATDTKYAEEVWSVPSSELDNIHAAEVRIRVATISGAGGIRYEATAEFPVGALHRAQITKSVEVPNPMKKI
jgi:type II secretory pathway component PulK